VLETLAYCDHPITLWGEELGSQAKEKVLPPGLHTFPFLFTLSDVPSSLEINSDGYIRYWVAVVVESSIATIKCKTAFTVRVY
jgi:hypothetical protein